MTKKIYWLSRKSTQDLISSIVIWILLISGAGFLMIPFLWMLTSALKPLEDIFLLPPKWIPNPVIWNNFPKALTALPFGTYLKNSCIITFSCIFGQLLSASLVAYGFARLRFPGRNGLFLFLLSTMMLPAQVTMIPIFILFRTIGWVNTLKPLIIPAFFGGGAFFIFLLRQFFMSIPLELDDAAKIDGCGVLGIWLRIILPLSKPALAAVAIFSFLGHWNDFMGPLIYLNSADKYTLALGLNSFRGLYGTSWNLLMAASIVVMLPCLIIFFFAQKYFIQGIVMTGLKG